MSLALLPGGKVIEEWHIVFLRFWALDWAIIRRLIPSLWVSSKGLVALARVSKQVCLKLACMSLLDIWKG
jgi:hypothetical protein